MPERTEKDMTPFQINSAGNPRTVTIVVPINYGNGVLVFSTRYSISWKHLNFPEDKYANLVGLVSVNEGCWINGGFKPKTFLWSAGLYPNLTVANNITRVLNFFKFLTEFIEKGDHRTIPPSFAEWRSRFEN